MDIDIERLKYDLKDYYGTAMFNGSPMVLMEVSNLERAGEVELIQMARNARLDLYKYQKKNNI